eukprot:TRINITY_DN1446_c0_g1_i3.p2 TRINITY_DN1446_c0_g1~~TRINITY_DN1446_c0_g1_i3.p2  ORF type:complete len:260 (-),score=94.67 TRINITY_DN1446_c0_g1_i3:226-1005(-)
MTTPPCSICWSSNVAIATAHGHAVCSPCFSNWLSAHNTRSTLSAPPSYPCCGMAGDPELLIWLGELKGTKDRERREKKKMERNVRKKERREQKEREQKEKNGEGVELLIIGEDPKKEEGEKEKEKEKETKTKEVETPKEEKKGNEVTTPPSPPFQVPEIPPNFVDSLSERLSLSLLRKDPHFRFCPNPRCGQGLVLEVSTPSSLSSPSPSPSPSPSTSTSTSSSTSSSSSTSTSSDSTPSSTSASASASTSGSSESKDE